MLSSNPLDAHRKVYVSGVKGVEMDVLTSHFGGFGTVVSIAPHGRGVIVEFADHDGAQRVCVDPTCYGSCPHLQTVDCFQREGRILMSSLCYAGFRKGVTVQRQEPAHGVVRPHGSIARSEGVGRSCVAGVAIKVKKMSIG